MEGPFDRRSLEFTENKKKLENFKKLPRRVILLDTVPYIYSYIYMESWQRKETWRILQNFPGRSIEVDTAIKMYALLKFQATSTVTP